MALRTGEEEVPLIACTLPPEEAGTRLAAFTDISAHALLRRERTGSGARLWFRPDVEAELRVFLDEEQACCAFFEFALTTEDGTIRLDVVAPEEAGPIVEGLFFAPC